jgi:hypothetical protein
MQKHEYRHARGKLVPSGILQTLMTQKQSDPYTFLSSSFRFKVMLSEAPSPHIIALLRDMTAA